MGSPVRGDELRLVHLFQPESNRRMRIEAPLVIGRYGHFHDYVELDGQVRYSSEEGAELQRLDFVEIAGDPSLSRNHVLFDPLTLTLRDLNSSNGTFVNDTQIPTSAGRLSPAYQLSVNDVIQVGGMRFVVEEGNAGLHTYCGQLSLDRHAIVAPIGARDAGAMGELLQERKWFQVSSAATGRRLLSSIDALQQRMGNNGILVVCLAAEPVGDAIRWGGEVIAAASLIRRLGELPGSKVLALQATGDPAAFEQAFLDTAYRDTILVTSTVPATASVDQGVEECMGTLRAEGVRKALSGIDSGAYHSVLDGLDALIAADSNVLDLTWIGPSYEGALRVFAGVLPKRRYEVEVCYGTAGVGSAYVRHYFDSARPPRSGSGLVGSW